MITLDDVLSVEDDAHFAKETFLDQQGWQIKDGFPGGIRLWCKEMNGVQVATNCNTAFTIEYNSRRS